VSALCLDRRGALRFRPSHQGYTGGRQSVRVSIMQFIVFGSR